MNQWSAEILDSEEYFTCERFRCRMARKDCLGRQQKRAAAGWPVYVQCQECPQGSEIAIQNEGIRKEGITMSDQVIDKDKSTKTPRKPCKNCDRLKVVRQHGMCGPCSKVSLAYPAGHPERGRKLAEVKERILTENDAALVKILNEAQEDMSKGCIYPVPEDLFEKRRAIAMDLDATVDPRYAVLVDFGNDVDLLDSILDLSKKHRRHVDQQILYLLDQSVAFELTEAGA